MLIKTGSWFTPLPEDHIRVGISRSTPRGFPAGYRVFRKLAPGRWFNSVTPADYLARYNAEILGPLDPREVASAILEIAGGKTPVLCCFEKVQDIAAGRSWCHRSIAGQWLKDKSGAEIEELGAPDNFDPWGVLRKENIDPPSFL